LLEAILHQLFAATSKALLGQLKMMNVRIEAFVIERGVCVIVSLVMAQATE
jgi:hypothetical protein